MEGKNSLPFENAVFFCRKELESGLLELGAWLEPLENGECGYGFASLLRSERSSEIAEAHGLKLDRSAALELFEKLSEQKTLPNGLSAALSAACG